MEVQILNVCLSANLHDLKRAIADVLHVPEFQEDGSPPINFEIFLFPAKDEARHTRGVLTLPSHDIGKQFLQVYGGSPAEKTILVGWYELEFKKSNKDPRPAVLKKITTMPYVDPKDEEEREQHEEDLRSRSVSVSAVQFGWECRDSVYSVEYERPCQGSGKLIFNGDRREFRVQAANAEINDIIVIRAVQIAWAALHKQSPTETVLFLALHWSPTYEYEQADEPESSDSRKLRKPPRQRLAALDNGHAVYAMYTSLALRFVCDEENALDNLLWLCKHARVKRNKHIYPVAQPARGLFAPSVQAEYREWLASLEWELAFQVDALARNNIMDLQEVLSLRSQLCRMAKDKDVDYLAAFVRHLGREAKDPSWYRGATNPKDALKELFIRCRKEFVAPLNAPAPDAISTGTHQEFECFHAIVTPSTVRLEGPFPERCNRVIRKYARHASSFLRVRFADEARLQFRSDRDVDCRAFIHSRFGNVLRRGLVIAGRHFHYLGYTQASLKEHTAWFAKEFKQSSLSADGTPHEEIITVDSIIAGLGVFDGIRYDPELIMCPARYGARQAQCFSSTEATVTVDVDDIEVIEDIWDANRERSFTDGVGTISYDLAVEIWTRLCAAKGRSLRESELVPRRFQIRIQGAKGMVSVDHDLRGRKLCLRPSMIKFYAADSRTLEIADAFVRPSKFYLNRPLIMLLEELDILGGYDFLKYLQDSVVENTRAATESLCDAAELFDNFNLGRTFDLSTVFRELAGMGITAPDDAFSRQIVNYGAHQVLRDLKYRARIPVPNGWNLVGVADVQGYLDEGQIFACVIPVEGQEPMYLYGPTLISRSPVIHRGDVQVVWAIGPPPLGSPFETELLHNSVVFATKGDRPLPSCLGGGDLDGDEYVCSDLAAILPQVVYEPAAYGKAVRKKLDRPSTRLDVADFLTEYLYSDTIGLVATNWLSLMDQSPQGVLDPASDHEHREALEVLAELHSKAADYPKTGTPVTMQEIPRSKLDSRPDWSAPEVQDGDTRVYYESQRWIGRLYREINLTVPEVAKAGSRKSHTFPSIDNVIDIFNKNKFPTDDPVEEALRVRITPYVASPYRYSRKRIEPVWDCFRSYVTSLRTLCTTFSLVQRHAAMLSEEEVVVGTIVAQTNQPHMRKERMAKMRDQAGQLVARTAERMIGSDRGDRKEARREAVKRAWVAFRVSTMQPDAFGSRSFGLIAIRELVVALKELEASSVVEVGERDQ